MTVHWSERLLTRNPNKYHLFKRKNESIIARDNTTKYEILPLYAEVGIEENYATNGYMNIKIHGCEPEYEDRIWVSIKDGVETEIFRQIRNAESEIRNYSEILIG